MDKKPKKKTFYPNALIDGHLIRGFVSFSPAPEPGIFAEVAGMEAERILAQTVRKANIGGRVARN